MNPDNTIRPWLLACGKQFGIRHAYAYRWPDEDTRPVESYCTYQIIRYAPVQDGGELIVSASGYNASRKAVQKHAATVQVDLYNSQDGLYELAAFCVAAQGIPDVRALFNGQCRFLRATSITDESSVNAAVVDYHQRLICEFDVNVELELTETNGVVDTITVNVEPGSYEWTIDRDGYS